MEAGTTEADDLYIQPTTTLTEYRAHICCRGSFCPHSAPNQSLQVLAEHWRSLPIKGPKDGKHNGQRRINGVEDRFPEKKPQRKGAYIHIQEVKRKRR